MKRRITIEQLNELSNEQIQKIKNLWKPQDGDWTFCILENCVHETIINIENSNDIFEFNDTYLGTKENCMPLFDIGQMIEILEDKTNFSQQIINEGGMYCISINTKACHTTGWNTEYYNELCDALWNAVISTL